MYRLVYYFNIVGRYITLFCSRYVEVIFYQILSFMDILCIPHIYAHTYVYFFRITPIKIPALLRWFKKKKIRLKRSLCVLLLIGVFCFMTRARPQVVIRNRYYIVWWKDILLSLLLCIKAVTDQREINYSIPKQFFYSGKIVLFP